MKLRVRFVQSAGWQPRVRSVESPGRCSRMATGAAWLIHRRTRSARPLRASFQTSVPSAVRGCPGDTQARRAVLTLIRMREMQSNQSKGQMKPTHSNTAPRTAAGITNKVMLVVAACLLAGGGFSRAQDAPNNVPGPDARLMAAGTNAAPAEDTNSPVAALAGDLLLLKVRIETALANMSDAVTSTPAEQAAKVTKLADGISDSPPTTSPMGGES